MYKKKKKTGGGIVRQDFGKPFFKIKRKYYLTHFDL